MLSEDIFQGMRDIGTTIGRVCGAAARGAIICGLAAAAITIGVLAFPSLVAAFSAGSLAAGLATAAAGIAGGLAAGGGAGLTFAIGGGIAMGIASLIPGKAELAGIKDKLLPARSNATQTVDSAQLAPAPQLTTQPDNPYFTPGLGAKLAQRGTAAEPASPSR